MTQSVSGISNSLSLGVKQTASNAPTETQMSPVSENALNEKENELPHCSYQSKS